jgi:D-alanine-D-alanine ligase
VDRHEDLESALDAAFEHDPKALVEVAIAGRELECGVLAGLGGGPPEASLPAEIRVPAGTGFYDFEAKYMPDSGTEFDIPPKLADDDIGRVRATALEAFAALDCEGLARVDFFLTVSGELLVNEVNTMPGFTPVSMFPQMWDATGVDYQTLVARLIDDAIHRGTGLR